jgi:hypothetical protein
MEGGEHHFEGRAVCSVRGISGYLLLLGPHTCGWSHSQWGLPASVACTTHAGVLAASFVDLSTRGSCTWGLASGVATLGHAVLLCTDCAHVHCTFCGV